MKTRQVVALLFFSIALVLGVLFFTKIKSPVGLEPYFQRAYYAQFGPLAICVELLLASLLLFKGDKKTNFTLALFGFTVVLDGVLNQVGLFSSTVPLYALIIFLICAVTAFWMVFRNPFKLEKISWLYVVGSFLLGMAIEFFFNFW